MKVQALTLDYPPRRFIGSELFTHRLLKALNHEVRASTVSKKHNPGFEGIPVIPFNWSDHDWADLWVCHADYSGPLEDRGVVVAVCHNTEEGVKVGLRRRRFDLVVCNSTSMRDTLAARSEQDYMVVRAAAQPGELSHGDRVTIVNLNDNKVGRFWDIARAMPEQGFLAVLGGYGQQVVPAVVPSNVEILEHVPADRMWEQVWSRTRTLLAPSIRESWNMTAADAVAHGIPVIATNLPGVRENVGEAGTYLDIDSVGEWVAAIQSHVPALSILAMAESRWARYQSDLAQFAEAVDSLGNSDVEAA